MAEQEAIGLLEQLARDFNVRDPCKLFQIARREFPDRRDLTSARAAPDSCMPFRVCTSVVMLGREASESVPPQFRHPRGAKPR